MPDQNDWTLWACACRVTDDDPGMIVCWVCEQPVATLDGNDLEQVLAANIIGHLTGRYEVETRTKVYPQREPE